jgi:hypothetical protein
MLIGHVCFRTITAHRQTAAGVAVATNPDGREFDSHMTKRWLIALFIAALFSGKTFADCVPSPDTPISRCRNSFAPRKTPPPKPPRNPHKSLRRQGHQS